MLKCNSIFVAVMMALGLSQGAQSQIVFEDEAFPGFEDFASSLEVVLEPFEADSGNDVRQSLGPEGNVQIANPRTFPAILRMRTRGTCTATVIGPSVIVMAAHCVLTDRAIRFRSGSTSVRAVCQRAPTYNRETHANDWALCLLNRPIRAGSIQFESIDTETQYPQGTPVLLTGFGCTFEGGDSDGRLRIGTSSLAAGPADEPSALQTVSSLGTDAPFLCPGDSGGPVFVFGTSSIDGPRRVIAVNSRTRYAEGSSIYSSLSHPDAVAFVNGFINATGARICGVNLDVGCNWY